MPTTPIRVGLGYALAGFVAGEGYFCISRAGERADGTLRRRFVFGVNVARRDRPMLEDLRAFLGCGSISDRLSRKPQWLPQSSFVINSLVKNVTITAPFADRYLLPSAKRRQFESWREEMYEHVADNGIRVGLGRSICSMDGCEGLVRGRGLCRAHYYRATGW